MTKFLLRVFIVSAALAALGVVPAFGYNETNVGGRVCSDCHGLESRTQETSVVVGTRKGPHGGYNTGTQKCDTCHMVHDAAGNSALLAEETIAATCNTCHDGTGGGGVYGAIRSHSATAAAGGHRVRGSSSDATVGVTTVPGGGQTGTFTGENNELTCTDCHSPHNSDTVNAYVGDRKRSTIETSTGMATNRLLRRKPTLATVAVDEYGTNWCQGCHSGGHMSNSHSVSRDASGTGGTFYNRIIARSAYGTRTASAVATTLGGSNLGYVMATETVRPSPICQQCHEDARSVGDVATFTVNAASEAYVANTDGVGVGNPRFQNFPHETQGANLLIEQGSDLCLNCHWPDPS